MVNFMLWVCNWLLVSCKLCLVFSHSTLRLVSPSKIPNHIVALWVACSKNMLISFEFYVEYLEIGVDCIVGNCGFSKLTGSTTC
jgi:hypothetical protein